MKTSTNRKVSLTELVDSVRVPLEKQVEGQGTATSPEIDESVGYLPGNVRPYSA